ncbi:MAG: type IX secretion system membrane protein PorP/SprF [Chitinophagaceae bacterium]|nr:type IX secretion system membrane protein PorP/SprF [Chitinophagaceae bacterium]MDP1763520.1 type IX secretion system membrane protein PorP/SprF [Sediminibacterium sp.]MDP1811257.1 type IX secretion system membrane protein PorP/SprF [Sediminibacterium sp.]MDP3127992.1 type IX secretion system membrane protein PorP/SprF [Sediminibacterium sp.]
MNVRQFMIGLGLFTCSAVMAQQRPYYTQYIMNNYIINPAVAGIENYWDVKASHRIQWVGLQDAPVTTYLTVHGPLKKSDYDRESATSFHANGQNPRGEAYWQDYTSAEPHHGVGFTILNDKTGPLNRFAAYGTYSYHQSLSPRTSLAAGISVGFTNMSLDAGKLNFGGTTVDPAVAGSGIINRMKPDISAGLWLYSKNYFIGLSAQQIIPQQIAFSDNTVYLQNGKLIPHLFLSAGYRMQLTDDISFLPSTLLRYISPLPVGIDVNAKFQYQDLLWAGGSYRYQDGFAAMVGINVNHNINIGYSYDIQTSTLNTVSKGTHEILIGFLLGNKYGDWCPRNLW